jgi:hypothetical protein
MNLFNNYIMSVPFEVDEINQAYKGDMIKKFIHDKIENNSKESGYNTLFDDPVYTNTIKNKFLKVIEDKFRVSNQLSEIKTWIYVQNNQYYNSVWHNHVTTSTINAVYYINPPEVGGELELTMNAQSYKFKPQINYLYLFPYWMEHRPVVQESPDWRISVNIEYLCEQRAIVKETGILW